MNPDKVIMTFAELNALPKVEGPSFEETPKEKAEAMKPRPNGGIHGEGLFFDPMPASPHKCPVCEGRGVVPNGFYLCVQQWTSANTGPETCKGCDGKGILWR